MESMAKGPIVSVNGKDGIGIWGIYVCIGLCMPAYKAVNFVHILSGQWFACTILKHGTDGCSGLGVAVSVSWCDLTLRDGAVG